MGLCLSHPHEVHGHLSPPVKLLPPLLSSTLPEDSVGEVDGIMGILGRCSSIILLLELKLYETLDANYFSSSLQSSS